MESTTQESKRVKKHHHNHHHHPHGKQSYHKNPSAQEADNVSTTSDNPFMPMFHSFRDELDEHHDRRERVIKTSRDITALSKKMIFTLQRIRQLEGEFPPFIAQDVATKRNQITHLFESLKPDFEAPINQLRYQRNISGGIQEYLEAVSFEHYLKIYELMSPTDAQAQLPSFIPLQLQDYFGGVMDLAGEMMRLSVTLVATVPRGQQPRIVNDMRDMRRFYESIDPRGAGGVLGKEWSKKMDVMKQSVEKVESAVYSMIVRGQERPAGWIPLHESGGGGARRGGDDDEDS